MQRTLENLQYAVQGLAMMGNRVGLLEQAPRLRLRPDGRLKLDLSVCQLNHPRRLRGEIQRGSARGRRVRGEESRIAREAWLGQAFGRVVDRMCAPNARSAGSQEEGRAAGPCFDVCAVVLHGLRGWDATEAEAPQQEGEAGGGENGDGGPVAESSTHVGGQGCQAQGGGMA